MPYDFTSSKPAYEENKQGKDYCRQMVLIAIRKLRMCNDRQLSEHLGWPINRITPRRGELVETGHVIEAQKSRDPRTGRTVSYWKEKPMEKYLQPSLFQ